MSHSLEVLTRLSTVVPPPIAERAATWSSDAQPATPSQSATVALVREAGPGLETYLLHRHARMSFAPSTVVFPGGRVDPVDGDTDAVRQCGVRETAEETGVVLDPGTLWPWAHWVTPEIEPRRFDTSFFVAVLPPGQTASDISGETDRAEWCTPATALAAADRGEIALMPPTRSVLLELAGLSTLAAVREMADGRVVERVLPRVVPVDGGWRFVYPDRLTS